MIYVAASLRDLGIRPIRTAPVRAPLPVSLLKTKPSVENGNFPPTRRREEDPNRREDAAIRGAGGDVPDSSNHSCRSPPRKGDDGGQGRRARPEVRPIRTNGAQQGSHQKRYGVPGGQRAAACARGQTGLYFLPTSLTPPSAAQRNRNIAMVVTV